MSEDEKHESNQQFTVIDRRREGRDQAAESPKKEPAPSPTVDQKAGPDPDTATNKAGERADFAGAEAFAQFIMSLATSAYLHLGMLADPSGGKAEKNLPLAKQTIDILGMLEDKTRGNLSKQEHALLKQVLSELRLHYVEIQKKG